MLAYAMGVIQEQQNPTTGERFDAIGFPDRFGDIEWEKIGKDFFSALKFLTQNAQMAMKIKENIEKKLKVEARSNEQKRELQDKVVAVLKERILNSTVCEGNTFDETYRKYKMVAGDLFDNELKEL